MNLAEKLLQSPKLINEIDKCPKKVGRLVKNTRGPASGTQVLLFSFDLKFSPVIGIDHVTNFLGLKLK